MERRSIFKIKLESFKLPRLVFLGILESFLYVAVVSRFDTTVVFVEGLLTLSKCI